MKTPDKIYIQTKAGETLSREWTTIPFRDFENTEYIRKDALLEWAKMEFIKTRSLIKSDWWEEIINKINSM